MRKSTLLWLALAVFCGVSLFYTSQKVHDSREKIVALRQEEKREEESVRVLRAEWSYLTQPKRLEKLANQYLHLVPLKGSYFIKLDDVPSRPAEVAATDAQNIEAVNPETAAAIKINAPLPKTAVAAATVKPSPAMAASAGKPRQFGDVMKSLGVKE